MWKGKLSEIAARWGAWVARWPNVTRLLAFLIFVVTAPGLINFAFEDKSEVLYWPKDAAETKAYKKYDSSSEWELWNFDNIEFMIAMHANGNNVLTNEGILTWNNFIGALNDIHETEIWARYDPMRMKYYYQDHFNESFSLPFADEELYFPYQTNQTWMPAIRYEAPQTASMLGKPRDSSGAIIPLNGSDVVSSAEILSASWRWTNGQSLKMVETCHSLVAQGMGGDFVFNYYSYDSVGHELLWSFINDAPKLAGALILLFVFCAGFQWRKEMSRNKTMLILAGIGCSVLAMLSGFGIGLGVGNPKHISQIGMFMPFLILAIGMDDMFVMIRSYELTSRQFSPEMRIAATMYDGGISITITSLTDFVAFLGGAIMIDMPAMHDLCLFVAYGILLLYLYTVTLMLSVMVCQARREAVDEKKWCACHLCGSTARSIEVSNKLTLDEDFPQQKAVDRRGSIGTIHPNIFRCLTRNYSKLWWRVLITFICIGYATVMTMGAVKLFNKVGLDYTILAPKGSFLVDWYETRTRYLDETQGLWGYMVVDDEDCDYADEVIKMSLVNIVESLAELECILAELGDSWINRIENCMTVGCVDSCRNTNWTTCYTWFQNVGTWYSDDGVWGDFSWWRGRFFDNKHMVPKATQFLVKMRAAEIHTFDRIECLDGIWSRLERAPCNMMPISIMYPFYAGDRTTVPGTWQLMVFALISCLLLCPIFIPNILVVLIIVFCVGFVLIGILGFSYYLDYRLDNATQTLFIMGIGFAVDFTVHISHNFLHAQGSRLEKAATAVNDMGEAIFLAAASTVLGVSPLFSSTSVILFSLASLLSIIMVIGLFISGILLPTILAMIGPTNPIQIKRESSLGVQFCLEMSKDKSRKVELL